LARRYRVICLHRRFYRLDIPVSSRSITHEVDDVVAAARAVGEPVVLYGHSDGAVIALEALAASPASFAGAVIFEPPVVIGSALSGEDTGALRDARAALALGRPGQAMAVFSHRVVGLPSWQARLVGLTVTLLRKYRRLVPGQIASLEALDRLGVRLDTYARIRVPMVLLGAERSPSHLGERLDALQQVIPQAVRVSMPGTDHGADVKQPRRVAQVIATLADQVLPPRV
jgi:pimeloyl-ACP methyl ester carboxylesterase